MTYGEGLEEKLRMKWLSIDLELQNELKKKKKNGVIQDDLFPPPSHSLESPVFITTGITQG